MTKRKRVSKAKTRIAPSNIRACNKCGGAVARDRITCTSCVQEGLSLLREAMGSMPETEVGDYFLFKAP